ncbi:CRE-CYP-13A6 protein [Caenorhabditis remanei]|uniref:Thromboxane-A synthase n=1 Tax=Caenorhabditis remanei TaxID=31234 RepID=E3MZW0_CAERE|nr:CRE-CYP-13A6 protein [Caenorhabditis remanei]
MILVLLTAILLGIFTYSVWVWSYFIRKGIKGPRGFPGIGMLIQTIDHENPPFLKYREWTKQYGPVWGFTEGPQQTMVISEPEMVNEIFNKQFDNFYGRKLRPIIGDPEKDKRVNLFAAQGKRWKRLRAMSSPSFSNNSLRKVKTTVQECGTEILWNIEKKVASGEDIDMLLFYQEYTLGVISRIALGQSESKMFQNPLLPKVKAVSYFLFSFISSHEGNFQIFNGSFHLFLLTGVFPPLAALIRKMSKSLPADFVPAFKIFDLIETAVEARIAQREADAKNGIEPGEPQDFIDLFLDARSDVDFLGEKNDDFSKSVAMKVNRELTFDEIVGQCFVFLAAGFDTTALSLSYATYLLATHPEIQKKLQEEVDRECPDPEISFDQLSKLRYMECVMKEALRLYPLGVTANTRKCMRETTIDGVTFEEGMNIQVDTWTLHHNPRVWGEDVEDFKPERWENSASEHLEHNGSYIPFGSGPRQCIGMRLAQMEQKILLAQILKEYSFRTTRNTQIPLKLVGKLTLSPESVIVKLEPRKDLL